MSGYIKIGTIIIFLAVFGLSFFLVITTEISTSKIVDGEFLFTSLGVIFGFAFTLLTFISSLLDKMREFLSKDQIKTVEFKKNITIHINNLNKELKDNIYFMFFSFIFIGIIILFDKVNIPGISFKDIICYTKNQVTNSIKLSIFFLNIFVIYDLLGVTFSVSKASGIIYGEEMD